MGERTVYYRARGDKQAAAKAQIFLRHIGGRVKQFRRREPGEPSSIYGATHVVTYAWPDPAPVPEPEAETVPKPEPESEWGAEPVEPAPAPEPTPEPVKKPESKKAPAKAPTARKGATRGRRR